MVSGGKVETNHSRKTGRKAWCLVKKSGLTALLVDDSVFVRRVLSRLLGSNPRIQRLFEASDAAEGYSLFKICRPDVVILDLELPDKHGLEVLTLIKRAAPSSLVIILTSLTAPEVREEALRLGADHFLLKDTGLLRVAETIATICDTKRKRGRSGNACKDEDKDNANTSCSE